MSTCAQGRVAIYAGRFAEGLAQLDDAMVRVISGETSPVIAGHVYCTAIEGAQEISDFGRVAEWTAALERWCDAQPELLAFTGQCAVHRGQLLRLRGAWDDALREYSRAAERYVELGTPDAIGLTAVETGDLLRLRGDLAGADEAYRRAADLGVDPQPGLALLWLAGGRGTAALAAVERLLAEPAGPVQRCRLLPAAIEVLLASGLVDRARPLAEELSSLASSVGSVVLSASAAQAMGAVELAAGDAGGALPYAAEGAPALGAGLLALRRRRRPPAHRPVPAGARRRVVGRARAVGRAIDPAPAGRGSAGRPRLVAARPDVPARRPDRA